MNVWQKIKGDQIRAVTGQKMPNSRKFIGTGF